MAASKRPADLLLDDKWEQCVDLSLRRFVYSSVAGVVAGFVLFRSPTSRRNAISFAAGAGLGSAYTDSSRILNDQLPTFSFPSFIPSPSQPPPPAAVPLTSEAAPAPAPEPAAESIPQD